MANKIKLAGTTANAFQIGLQGVTLNAAPATSAYQLNLPANVGSSNQYLKTDGTGNLSWATVSGGSGTPGGANTQIQFNDDSAFGGSAAFTFNKTSNVIAATGNINANYFIGNGALLTGITTGTQSLIANGTSNVSIPTANGNITFSANAANSMTITSSNVVIGTGTGAAITGVNSLSANTVSTTGNVTANFFIGNGSQLTGLSTSSISNGTSNVSIPAANGNVNISAGGQANRLIVTSTGANITGTISASGNVTAAYYFGNGALLTGIGSAGSIANGTSNINIPATNGNIIVTVGGVANLVTFTTANTIVGSTGSGGNITGANVITANSFTGNLTTNAQPNITSVGTLTSLSVSGNVSMSSNTVITVGVYTTAGKPTTGLVGQIIALSDSSPGGMLAYWDTTNARWSYVHDNSAV